MNLYQNSFLRARSIKIPAVAESALYELPEGQRSLSYIRAHPAIQGAIRMVSP
jgi:hypothetical protein